MDKQATPYQGLSPERILHCVEAAGYRCNGQLLALNSYENRVYQVGLEDAPPLVVKFYRPGRWSDAMILEEHAFTRELAAREIPVVAPLHDGDGRSLWTVAGFRFALYPRRGGRAPELERADDLRWLGRFIARIHALGAVRPFEYRPRLTVHAHGREALAFITRQQVVPEYLRAAYQAEAAPLLDELEAVFEAVGPLRSIRLHGDCHPGNILWTDAGPHFVDFDDALMGPAVQDLWMLLSGEREEARRQLEPLLEGYGEFFDFDQRELLLVEALRGLRLIHYSAWLARRWSDPAFPRAFPWFASPRYWEEQVQVLREQRERLAGPGLLA